MGVIIGHAAFLFLFFFDRGGGSKDGGSWVVVLGTHIRI